MGVFLTAEWRDLAVMTYRIDPSALLTYLPPGLHLDLWQGEALVSLVGFRFLRTRVLGCPIPFRGNFPEVNLRFYVCRDTPHGLRRGVVFIKEFVPYYAVAAIARGFYNENYFSTDMSCAVTRSKVEYRWSGGNRIAVSIIGMPTMPGEESLDTFILDHRWGYGVSRRGACIEYEVERLPWRTYTVGGFEVEVDCARIHGARFAEALAKPPMSVVLGEGSGVSVSFGRVL